MSDLRDLVGTELGRDVALQELDLPCFLVRKLLPAALYELLYGVLPLAYER